ncbi:hypothetical protein D9619_004864 [Psilocybe cf. subviscida]|uniref:NAD(P)-binding domain-containing protein n=1 Tax=Psilocybe cf. subviscida TaxID=2480587 RepID=A0A8H5BQU6_9AGAR|nr:hypothetical protein D9619_004864 [Psilocybe cf. subviscida]
MNNHSTPRVAPTKETLYMQLLPPELWLQIFYWGTLQSNHSRGRTLAAEFVSGKIWPPKPDTPLEVTISQTCVYFRRLAVEDKSLWTTIRLDATCRLSDIRRRIHRSTPLTLDVDIDLLFEGAPNQYPMLNAAMDLLMAESTRWRRLRVRIYVERMHLPLEPRLRLCRAPKLQSLSLKVTVIGSVDPTTLLSTPQILLNGAPALIFARLRGVALKHCRPPVHSLVTLHLDGTQYTTIPFSTFSNMLGASPNLCNLSIFGNIVERQAWTDQNIILLPNLLSLRLCSHSGFMYSSFLLGTNAPKLKYLILKGIQSDMDLERLWSGRDGRDRTFPVEHLTFIDFNLSTFAYSKLFRIFPGIVGHASLRTLHTESHLVQALLTPEGGGNETSAPPWPELQHLQLAFNQTCKSSSILPRLIELREEQCLPLAQVSLIFSPDEADELDTPSIPIHFTRSVLQQLLTTYGYAFADDQNGPHTDHDDIFLVFMTQPLNTTNFVNWALWNAGYIGGSVLARLLERHDINDYIITALVRSPEKADKLKELGVNAVVGSHSDEAFMESVASEADVVIATADADDLGAAQATLRGLKRRYEATGKAPIFIHTSGTGVLADDSAGDPASTAQDIVYSDADANQIETLPDSRLHRNVDLEIVRADKEGKTYIVLPSTIYGIATGVLVDRGIQNAHSLQVPAIVRASLIRGRAGMIGQGKNTWPDVSIIDISNLFVTLFGAIIKDPSSVGHGREGFYFGETAEHTMYEVGLAVGESMVALGKASDPTPTTFTQNEVDKFFQGSNYLGTNSRCRANRSRAIGWAPIHTKKDFLESIKKEVEILAKYPTQVHEEYFAKQSKL